MREFILRFFTLDFWINLINGIATPLRTLADFLIGLFDKFILLIQKMFQMLQRLFSAVDISSFNDFWDWLKNLFGG